MNFYECLNKIIEYIEENLESDIDYSCLARIMGTNEYTIKRIFPIITNISISDYIRNRRLSNAGIDLYKENYKIIDIAIKYGYDSATSFSRAFEKFHGIKPSAAKSNPENLKIFPKLYFEETTNNNDNIEYSIIEMEEKIIYAKGKKTQRSTISKDAPEFFEKMEQKLFDRYGNIQYGLVTYESRKDSDNYEYWIGYDQEIEGFEKLVIPKSKWLLFKIDSQDAEEIQRVSWNFYDKFLPSAKFTIRPLPEIEYYHDGITDFLVPIDD